MVDLTDRAVTIPCARGSGTDEAGVIRRDQDTARIAPARAECGALGSRLTSFRHPTVRPIVSGEGPASRALLEVPA